MAYLCGTVVCLATGAHILVIDRLFRWNVRVSVRNVEDNLRPTGYELGGRYALWTILLAAAAYVYITGCLP